MDHDFDCVVVGGGVAGLSAAMVLGRARRPTLLLDRDGQSNRAAAHIGGLLGHDGTPPGEFYELGRKQVAAYDAVELRDAEAVDARVEGDGFAVELGDAAARSGRARSCWRPAWTTRCPTSRVRGAVGRRGVPLPVLPRLGGARPPVAVYGPGEVADRLATLLAAWTDDVTVVDPADVAGVRVEDDSLKAVVRHDGSEVRCDAVLVHAPLRRRDALPSGSGSSSPTTVSWPSTPGAHERPRRYAAGDLAVAPQQVAIALGSGHLAGLVAMRELLLGRG